MAQNFSIAVFLCDLNDLKKVLMKITVETTLKAEHEAHLGCRKYDSSGAENSRNGYTRMTPRTEDGQF